jgi:hypothetical protein
VALVSRGIAGLRLALPCAAVALLCGCGSEGPSATTVVTRAPAESELTAAEVESAPSAQPPQPETDLALQVPEGAHPVIWVADGAEAELRTQPGGGERVARIGGQTRFGSPSVFGVIEQRGDWAGISTERLPNGELGWIQLDAGTIEAGWTKFEIVVDLSDRMAELRVGDEVQRSFAVTVGAPASSTPTGVYSVTDTFTDLASDAYGCCALAISATQPNLPSGWLGGNRIAIHGTEGELGVATSSGCVRAADGEVRDLVRTVPLGTPVSIRA